MQLESPPRARAYFEMSQLVPTSSLPGIVPSNEWILKISMEGRRATDAAAIVQRIIAGSQYFYLVLARLKIT
jgi:hypothetical protein